MADFTSVYHRTSYPSISSANPINSQTSRTVLITGASAGIGASIARSFAAAGTSCLILLGRTKSTLVATAAALPNAEARVCDISSVQAVKDLWESLRNEGVHVDVLVLNAAVATNGSLREGWEQTVETFETSVFGNLRMAQAFVAQMGDKDGHALINISSFMAHANKAPGQGAYAASKVASASIFQHLSEETPSQKAQIISVHPGAILTEAARAAGFTEDSAPWDDASLPGDFAVWASTTAANFLHGRFGWTSWDVDELMQRRDEIVGHEGLLRIGLQGVHFISVPELFARVLEKTPTNTAA